MHDLFCSFVHLPTDKVNYDLRYKQCMQETHDYKNKYYTLLYFIKSCLSVYMLVGELKEIKHLF